MKMKCAFIVQALLVVKALNLNSLVQNRKDPQLHLVRNTSGESVDATQSCIRMNNRGSHFTVEVSVGTPMNGVDMQKFDLVADTGSNAVIVQSCICKNVSAECHDTGDCFLGTNRSSTFIPPEKNATPKVLSFGSGDIATYVTTDVVQLGQAKAMMTDGLLLMVNRALEIGGEFEGILGFGVPTWVQEAKTPPKIAGADPDNQKKMLKNLREAKKKWREEAEAEGHKLPAKQEPSPRFLEEAKVDRFSICMNDDGSHGVMRLNPPAATKMLPQIGYYHWSLDIQGISAGSATAPITICDKSSKPDHMDAACAGIPDSGTTLIMGPEKQVTALYGELCDRWPRCKNVVKTGMAGAPAEAFVTLIRTCGDWMGADLKEIPSVFVHAAGADGSKQILELTSWSYIIEREGFFGKTCEPLFGVWEHPTALHGDVWIFGTPMFYEYQVVFQTKPAAIGFSEEKCGSCDASAAQPTSFALDKPAPWTDRPDDPARHVPRVMSNSTKFRRPSFDPSLPL